jgi:ribonuclease HI
MDESRPTWAYIADEIFRSDAPGELKSLLEDPNARTNQFLQTWHSRTKRKTNSNTDNPTIPDDLREMIKIAKKYGVRLEATHPTQEVRTNLPAIRSNQTNPGTKPDTLCDKPGKCLRSKHKIQSLQDVLNISSDIPRNHRRSKRCKCTKCSLINNETNNSCKHPFKCIERAATLLKSINEKWNPQTEHPPEFFITPHPNEVGPKQNPDTMEITHTLDPFDIETSLADCFRIFTSSEPTDPSRTSRAERTIEFTEPETTIYTDGSCSKNGESIAHAGSGIWFGENDPRNISLRVPGPDQSNQSGELYAILHAISSSPPDRALSIMSDSMYAINGITKYLQEWENQGWLFCSHPSLFKKITAWIRYRSNTTKITWIKGHNNIRGNDKADNLAREGSQKNLPTTDPIPNPPQYAVPSGAKLSALAQRDLYRIIKKMNPPPPRPSTQLNIDRIQACTINYYDVSPSYETIWKSTRHKDLTKKTQEFLWKSIHNAFKIGKYWSHIKDFEDRGRCPHCDTDETMEHILTECDAPGRSTIWALANELWNKRSRSQIPTNFGALLGCGLTNFKKDNGKIDKGLNRLYRIVVSESMYTIWKIRCERAITWNNDPEKLHTTNEIHNKWLAAINARLKMDSVQTNNKIFKKKQMDPKTVLKTWKNCLKDNMHHTKNWCGKTGVLVGIAPKRPPGRNR